MVVLEEISAVAVLKKISAVLVGWWFSHNFCGFSTVFDVVFTRASFLLSLWSTVSSVILYSYLLIFPLCLSLGF